MIVLLGAAVLAVGRSPAARGAEPPLTLLFVGDVSFAGRATPRSADEAAGPDNPLAAFGDRFRRATAVFANAEGLLTAERPPAYREARLDIGASPHWAGAFAAAGVTAVGLANNHSWDGGAAGVLEQRSRLEATGVATFGAGTSAEEAEAPWLLERGTRCVAVLPATLKSNRPARPGASVAAYLGAEGLDRLAARVRALRDRGCFVAVSVHWGREGVHTPPRAVVAAAERLVDAGAGLVVGHHPHVLQGLAWRGGAAIAYSLGNFVFTNRTLAKRETGVLAVTLSDTTPPRLLEVSFEPALIALPSFSPRPATPREAEAIGGRLAAWSAALGAKTAREGGRVRLLPPAAP